jgi:cardiolipin synthase
MEDPTMTSTHLASPWNTRSVARTRRSRRGTAPAVESLESRRLLATLESGSGSSILNAARQDGDAIPSIMAESPTALAPPNAVTIGSTATIRVSDAISAPAARVELHAHAEDVIRAIGTRGSVVLEVTRTGDTSRALRLPIRAVGGSAAAGSDYSRRLVNRRFARFAAGEQSTLVSLPLARPRVHQPEETLELRIGGRGPRMPVVRTTVILGATETALATPAPLIAAQPDDQGRALLDLLATATRSIDIVIYQIGDPEIATGLLDRMAAGVKVRLVLDNSTFGNVTTNSTFVVGLREAMATRGIAADKLDAHWSSGNFSITHQKSVIIDAVDATGSPLSPDGLPASARVLISSGNFATSAEYGPFWNQRNFYVTVADPVIVAEAARVFVSDFNCDGRSVTNDLGESSILIWSNGSTNRWIGEQGLYPDGGNYYPDTDRPADWDLVSLIPRDEGNVVAYQIGLIEQARAGDVLRIYTLEYASSIVAEALENAAHRGVDVRVVTTYQDDAGPKKQNLTALATAGGTVTYFAPFEDVLYIHAKAMLLSRDGAFVRGFVGSQNFSDPSMQFNRELGIPLDLTYADVAAKIGQSFDADFTFQGGTPDRPSTAQLTRSNPSTVPASWRGSRDTGTSESFVRPGCGCLDEIPRQA